MTSNKYLLLTLLAFIAISTTLIIYNYSLSTQPNIEPTLSSVSSIEELDKIVLDSYICELTKTATDVLGREYIGFQENGLDYINYWVAASYVISILTNSSTDKKLLHEAENMMQCLQDTFHRHGYFPRPTYLEFAYGWASSMDAPTIMVAAQMMYEKTKKMVYKKFVDELIEYVVKDVKDGGFSLYLNNGRMVWPLEYARRNEDIDSAEMVLNGSLVGYLGIKIIAEITDNTELNTYLAKVDRAYKTYFPKFHYNNKQTWSYYMLNPKTVIPPHYCIFELQLFSAIWKLTNIQLYHDELVFRKQALKSVLAPQFRNLGVGECSFIIRRACAPHPYLIDVYSTEIRFTDSAGTVLGTYTNNISGSCAANPAQFKKGEYLYGAVPANASRYIVLCHKPGNITEELFNGVIEDKTTQKTYIYNNMPDITMNAVKMHDRIIKILPDNKYIEARLTYNFPYVHSLAAEKYYAFKLNNLSKNYYNIAAIIYDSQGNTAERYYTKLIPGKNLLLFSDIGFRNHSNITDISNMAIRIYTFNIENDGQVEIDDYCVTNDLYKLKEFEELGWHVTPD